MIHLLWSASTNIRTFTRRHMPSNILLDAIRTRRGLKWGAPTMLLAFLYLAIANLCALSAAKGGPGWLQLIVLACIWGALKMVWIGPISLVLLVRARMRESADYANPESGSDGAEEAALTATASGRQL